MGGRARAKLSARFVQTVTEPGRHSDGGGLYLVVDKNGAKRWAFIFRWQGRQPEMGLGGYPATGLKEAREAAAGAERLVRAGVNPIEARRAKAISEQAVPTFEEFAKVAVSLFEAEFKNPKHRQQWRNTLATYCSPIARMPVDQISTDDVLRCLEPIWSTKPETASRLRGRIERVLDAARAKGLRSGENPARWRGHLQAILPKRRSLSRGHHKALPHRQMPEFMAALRERNGVAAHALAFAILTAARTEEVLGATWAEMNLAEEVWTVPAARMKASRDHRIPLPPAATQILKVMQRLPASNYVFPGSGPNIPLSNMSMTRVLQRMKADCTVHGFRSTFRDWAGDDTDFRRETIEAALAHIYGDKAERAYRRSDALRKRRVLMVAWEDFISGRDWRANIPADSLEEMRRPQGRRGAIVRHRKVIAGPDRLSGILRALQKRARSRLPGVAEQ